MRTARNFVFTPPFEYLWTRRPHCNVGELKTGERKTSKFPVHRVVDGFEVIANVTGERQTPEGPSVFMTGNPACDVALWPLATFRCDAKPCPVLEQQMG